MTTQTVAPRRAARIEKSKAPSSREAHHRATEALLRQRERQQAAVARLGHEALRRPPMQDLFDAAVHEVASTLDCDISGILEWSPDAPEMVIRASVGMPSGHPATAPAGPGTQAAYILSSEQPVVIPDFSAEARFEPVPALVAAGVRSGMNVAIPTPGGPFGVMGVHSLSPRDFTQDDANFLDAVAHVLASAIDQRRSESLVHLRVRQQAALARLGHQALVCELPSLVTIAAREVATTLEAEFCKVLELDRDGRLLVLRAGTGWRAGSIGQATVPADEHSQAGFALRSNRAVIVDDLATETRFEPAPLLVDHRVVSGMSVIIRGHQQPYGVIGVHSRQRRAFTADDINFLETVAALLGTAVERRRVQEELHRHRAHLEDEVADRTRQLAASNRELEAFSYSVSHDLRAPLRTITGYSTLLAKKHATELNPEALELIHGVRKSAERLGRLIDDLLDLSRVQRVDLVRERVDLSAIARQTLAVLASAEPKRGVQWDVQPGLTVDGDGRLLGMLMDNLLANAWKFTRRTAGASITVARTDTRGESVFLVKDNGAGLDMAYAGKLFQPFQRLHRPSEFEGTGIGLATVRRIVERHGGRVWVDARPGAGATFYFTLGGSSTHHPPMRSAIYSSLHN